MNQVVDPGEVRVWCPECGGDLLLRISRKQGNIRYDCQDCDLLEKHVINYKEGVTVGVHHD